MTGRERTYNILHFKKADRMPAVHFGYWPELLEEWVAQGHLRREDVDGWYDGGPKDEALNRILGWDFDWQHMFPETTDCCLRLRRRSLRRSKTVRERFRTGTVLSREFSLA